MSIMTTTKLASTTHIKKKVAMVMITMMTTPTIMIKGDKLQLPVLFISQLITDTISTHM